MELHPDLEKLAQQLSQRRNNSPLLLFLGAGVAQAAGVPGIAKMARTILPTLGEDYAMMIDASDEELLQVFYGYLESMSRIARYSMLQRFYSRLPVPRFYQDIVQLINSGCFQQIITTSIDTLLEEALNQSGRQRGFDYQVTSFLNTERAYTAKTQTALESAHVQIVKLHGDLAQRQIAITPDEIAQALLPQRQAVKGALSGDIVMVGYQFESPPLEEFLRGTTGDIWWVSPEHPGVDTMTLLQQAHTLRYIEGANAQPENFFGLLNILVNRPPIPAAQSSPNPNAQSRGLESMVADATDSEFIDDHANSPSAYATPLSSGTVEEYYLYTQLQRSQTELSSLKQQLVTSDKSNDQLQVQIDYERRQIAQLEDRLRTLVYSGEEVIAAVKAVAMMVRHKSQDVGTISFMRKQVNTVTAEYGREQPNQAVIGAAIGATVLLAERLAPDVVDGELLAKLLPMTPSAMTRRR